MFLPEGAVFDNTKLKFMKEQEASELLSSFGINTPFSKILLLGHLLFELLGSFGINTPLSKILLLGPLLFEEYKMNEIVNKFLIAPDIFMPEMHLRQPEFTYSA